MSDRNPYPTWRSRASPCRKYVRHISILQLLLSELTSRQRMGVNWIESELATHRARSVCVSIGPWQNVGQGGKKRANRSDFDFNVRFMSSNLSRLNSRRSNFRPVGFKPLGTILLKYFTKSRLDVQMFITLQKYSLQKFSNIWAFSIKTVWSNVDKERKQTTSAL